MGKTTLFVLAIAIFIAGATDTAYADKRYWVDRVQVAVSIDENGDVRVTEEMSYRFRGRYRYAFRDIPLDRGIDVVDVRVAESGQAFTQDTSEAPGTFHIAHDTNQLRITWYYDAKNEARSFTLHYRVTGAVKRHQDVAEFYYQFIGDGWEKSIGQAEMRVDLPRGIDPSDVKAWVHGPLYGSVRIAGESRVDFEVAPLPRRTFFEGRILFPSSAVASLRPSGEGSRLAAIMAEENVLAAESDRQRASRERRVEQWREQKRQQAALARQLLPVAFVLGLCALGVWFVLFRRVGWRHAVTSRTPRGQIPSDHAPAIVSYLVARTVGGTAIVATLLELSERGYFEVRETVETRETIFGRKEKKDYHFDRTAKALNDLAAFELNLVGFMMDEAGNERGFTMLGLKTAAKKRRSHFRKWYGQWVKAVNAAGRDLNFFEPYAVGTIVLNVIVGVLVAAAGVAMSVMTDSPSGVPAILGGALGAILSVTLNRRTHEGQRLMLAWADFKVHLKSISRAMGPTTLNSQDWARYLAIAVIFGMHKKLLPQLRLSGSEAASGFPIWYYAVLGSGPHTDGLASMAAGMTAMVSSVTTTVSSSTGAGGGASVGGGGGAGGGGGGAG